MTWNAHCFTSITSNYLPKARVLAGSLKQRHPEIGFHLMLSDDPPANFDLGKEPFDSLLTIDQLPIPNLQSWIFKHRLVELCTAVKGVAAKEIARRCKAEQVFYFDPDIVIFGGVDRLSEILAGHSIVLTPHLTAPESSRQGILDNEISALKHGIFNLGFIGINVADEEGRRFLDWWAARLQEFCYDDISGGLFTDQRWVDLAPGLFAGAAILRDPEYNVATWNLSHRTATGSLDQGILINGKPLSFYHFSGFDSGAQETMLKRYGQSSSVLFELREWYINACSVQGQEELGKRPCKYAFFDNGEIISETHRLLYRHRSDLNAAFTDPFNTADVEQSYYHWFLANGPAATELDVLPEAVLRAKLDEALRILGDIQRSRSWKLSQQLSRIVNAVRR